MMKTTCHFAVPDSFVRKYRSSLSNLSKSSKDNQFTAQIEFNPAACKSFAGKWFAERITSTLHQDENSSVNLFMDKNGIELWMSQFSEMLSRRKVRGERELAQFIKELHNLPAEMRAVEAFNGPGYFLKPISNRFGWPALGSPEANDINHPAAYFDFCAESMLALNPTRISIWNGEEMPTLLFSKK